MEILAPPPVCWGQQTPMEPLNFELIVPFQCKTQKETKCLPVKFFAVVLESKQSSLGLNEMSLLPLHCVILDPTTHNEYLLPTKSRF